MSERYRQPCFEGWEVEEPKAIELQELFFCREHLSVIIRNDFGHLQCYEGREPIISEEQVITGMGYRIDIPSEDTEEE